MSSPDGPPPDPNAPAEPDATAAPETAPAPPPQRIATSERLRVAPPEGAPAPRRPTTGSVSLPQRVPTGERPQVPPRVSTRGSMPAAPSGERLAPGAPPRVSTRGSIPAASSIPRVPTGERPVPGAPPRVSTRGSIPVAPPQPAAPGGDPEDEPTKPLGDGPIRRVPTAERKAVSLPRVDLRAAMASAPRPPSAPGGNPDDEPTRPLGSEPIPRVPTGERKAVSLPPRVNTRGSMPVAPPQAGPPGGDPEDEPTKPLASGLVGRAQAIVRGEPSLEDIATAQLTPDLIARAQAIAQEGKRGPDDETTDPERVQVRSARPTERTAAVTPVVQGEAQRSPAVTPVVLSDDPQRSPAVTPVALSDAPQPRSDARPRTQPNEATHVGVAPARPGPPVPNADDETTAELGLSAVPSRKPGAYSRANLADESRPEDSDISRVVRYEALQNSGHRRQGFQIAIAAVVLSLAAVATVVLLARHDRPSLEELQVAYPYGFSGGQLQNGRTAPPATQVLYEYESNVDCGETVCAHYVVRTADGSFRIEMNLRKDDGEWHRVDAP